MKRAKILLLVFLLILLFGMSDLIFLYKNEPQKLGKIYLSLAIRENKNSKTEKALYFLNKAAELHLKKNKLIYPKQKLELGGKSDISNSDEKTKEQIHKYLLSSLKRVYEKNTSASISNIYYNLGLIAYQSGNHSQANFLFSKTIVLDPELGHLYLEVANSFFNDGQVEEGKRILQRCEQFQLPKNQCREYLEVNVESGKYLQVGEYREAIADYQLKYY